MSLQFKKMPLNALKMIYCKFHIAQIIDIENIDNIIKGALEVFLSVYTEPKKKLSPSLNVDLFVQF